MDKMKKWQKMALYKALWGMIMVLGIVMLTSIPAVSALEFDNVKSFDSTGKYGTITIENIFGLGSKLAEYTLLKNTDNCLEDCYAEGKTILYDDGILFSDIEFEDNLGRTKLLENKIFIEVSKTTEVDVNDYVNECDIKAIEGCSQVLKGTHKENVINNYWVEYDGKSLKAGDYKWRIEGKKGKGENIDWVVTSLGEKLTEWAWWSGSYTSCKNIDFTVATTRSNETVPINFTVGTDWAYFWTLFSGDSTQNYSIYYNSINDFRVIDESCQQGGNEKTYELIDNNTPIDNGGVLFEFVDFGWGEENTKPLKADWTTRTNVNYSSNQHIRGALGLSLLQFGVTEATMIYTRPFDDNGVASWFFQDEGTADGYYFGGWSNATIFLALQTGVHTATSAGNYVYRDEIGYGDTGITRSTAFHSAKAIANSSGGTLLIDGAVARYNPTFTNASSFVWWGSKFQHIDSIIVTTGQDINQYVSLATYTLGAEQTGNTLLATLVSPDDNENFITNLVTFQCNGTDETEILNITLIINDVDNETKSATGETNLTLITTKSIVDGDHNWTCRSSDVSETANAVKRDFSIDTIYPSVSATNLTDILTITLPVNSSWILNASDLHLESCWYNSTEHSTRLVTCNSTIPTTQWTTTGAKSITYCANDTFNYVNCSTSAITITYFNVSSTESKDPAGEGDEITYTLKINASAISSTYSQTNASFTLNAIDYQPTAKSTTNADMIIFTKVLVIPNATGDDDGEVIDWHWNYTIRNSVASLLAGSEVSNTTVYAVNISDSCSGGEYVILNLNLKDEETNELAEMESPNVTNIEIDLTLSSWSDATVEWEYSNTFATNNQSLCVPEGLLNFSSYRIDWVIGYDSNSRVREFHYLDNGTLDKTGIFNSLTNNQTNLYDLATADSTTFLFSYTDIDGLTVPNSIVHTFRKYIGEGIFREVERSKQDSNGETHVHLVEEDVIYYFIISEDGVILYTSDTYNAKCLSSPCSISLTGLATETNWSLYDNEGGRYYISTDKATRTATVTFDIETSGEVNASVYEYDGGVPVLIDSDTLTATSGSVAVTVPVSYGNATYFVAIHKNDVFVKSGWLDLTEGGKAYFGTMGALLGGIIVLAMVLMAVSEGIGILIFAMVALIVIVIMQLVEMSTLSIISIILAGGIIVFKLMSRRNR